MLTLVKPEDTILKSESEAASSSKHQQKEDLTCFAWSEAISDGPDTALRFPHVEMILMKRNSQYQDIREEVPELLNVKIPVCCGPRIKLQRMKGNWPLGVS